MKKSLHKVNGEEEETSIANILNIQAVKAIVIPSPQRKAPAHAKADNLDIQTVRIKLSRPSPWRNIQYHLEQISILFPKALKTTLRTLYCHN